MDWDRCPFGQGLTRAAFFGRGAIVAGAALAGSAAVPPAASPGVGE
jgi:hypothetical protein